MVAGRYAKPLHLIEATGTGREDRTAAFREPCEPIGDQIGGPPQHLTGEAVCIWRQLSTLMPWLRVHHAPTFEMYIRLIVQMREGDLSSPVVNGMMRCAAVLGGDPRNDQRFIKPNSERDEHFDA